MKMFKALTESSLVGIALAACTAPGINIDCSKKCEKPEPQVFVFQGVPQGSGLSYVLNQPANASTIIPIPTYQPQGDVQIQMLMQQYQQLLQHMIQQSLPSAPASSHPQYGPMGERKSPESRVQVDCGKEKFDIRTRK